MGYTVVVKTITSSNGAFERKRYNNVPKRIIKFLTKNNFSFMVGIADHTVNKETAKYYIEVYTKSTFGCEERHRINSLLNKELFEKLRRLQKRG